MKEKDKAIGVLDSGVGGLTLVREFTHRLPGENIVYFGDTARMPYGPREPEEVRDFALEIMDFLCHTQDVKLLIVACNTATAVGLAEYRSHFSVPVLGVLEPGARGALAATRNRRIGIIGTEGTIASKAYPRVLHAMDSRVAVFDKACPLFVLLVENQLTDTVEAEKIAESYLQPLKEMNIDTLILGCTHYPLLEHLLVQVLGEDVAMVSSALHTAVAAREILVSRNLLRNSRRSWQRYFVSGDPANFSEIGRRLLGYELKAYRVMLSGGVRA